MITGTMLCYILITTVLLFFLVCLQTEGYVTAALGNTWSHCVNTRLIVQYLDGPYRQVCHSITSCQLLELSIHQAKLLS